MHNVRPFTEQDFEPWCTLFRMYEDTPLPDDEITETWQQLLSQDNGCQGIAVFDDHNVMQGFAHIVIHGYVKGGRKTCYLEDLFIHPGHRQQGLAKQLMDHINSLRKNLGCFRLYWITQPDNLAAQKLYNHYADGDHWLRYVMEDKD